MSTIIDYYSNVQSKEIKWLWYPYIPLGKLTLLQGDPGEGKSSFIIQVIAAVTRGAILPGAAEPFEGTVLYQCDEDNKADTIKPRLVAAGADCEKVAFIDTDENALTLDDERIEKAISMANAKMFVIDPIQSFLTSDSDMQNVVRARKLLKNIADIADRHQCAFVMIGHMNKAVGGKSIYRGLGSVDFAAIARSILMLVRDRNETGLRYVYQIKSNLSVEGKAIQFILDENHGFQWNGFTDRTLQEVLHMPVENTKMEDAMNRIQSILEDGDCASNTIFKQLAKAGISKRTVQTAKQKLDVDAYKSKGEWFWHLN